MNNYAARVLRYRQAVLALLDLANGAKTDHGRAEYVRLAREYEELAKLVEKGFRGDA